MDLIIFDLDGTLVDTKELHQESFAWALKQEDPNYDLPMEDFLLLEGRPTLVKVEHLRKKYNWPLDTNRVYENKQLHTIQHLKDFKYNLDIRDRLNRLSKKYHLALASNARSGFVFEIITHMQLTMFEVILSANYIPRHLAKPSPYIFLQCMKMVGVSPTSTIIFEDSEVGLIAAHASGAKVISVQNSVDAVEKMDLLCR